MDEEFSAELWQWRGPAPYYFVPVPAEQSADIREVSAIATYGWGVIPVEARIAGTSFETSLFPRDGGYLLPLKEKVRRALGLTLGDPAAVELTVRLDGAAGSQA